MHLEKKLSTVKGPLWSSSPHAGRDETREGSFTPFSLPILRRPKLSGITTQAEGLGDTGTKLLQKLSERERERERESGFLS